MKTRLFITDDHDLVRAGLVQFLGLSPDIEVVGEAAEGKELLEKLHTTIVDVLLLDLVMPGLCGTELISQIRNAHPGIRILVLSMHNETRVVLRTLKAGVSGYLCKDCTPQNLLEAIRKIKESGKYLSPALAEQIAFASESADQNPIEHLLSERERQIFHMIVDGKSIKDISKQLAINAKTVSTHKFNLLNKLGVKSVADLVRYAIQEKL
ncbi:MAG: response regulator transcription factor [Nitrosomonadales bacterium]|nr:response regulator transcription factor [Nitrosomonadales bacterium]